METKVDYLVIGAGPSGLQIGYYLEKAKRDYCILEAGETAGTFFTKYPRHRTLISINKVYTGYKNAEVNLRFDWNSLLSDDYSPLFKQYDQQYFPAADNIVNYFNDFAEQYHLNVKYGVKIVKISKPDEFQLEDQQGNLYIAKRLIIATGFTKPYLPPIPGIELTENYVDVSVNPDDFKNQRVLIIGKGNSGFETANNLVETAAVIHILSPHSLNLAWKTHYVGHLRAVNNNFLDTYHLKSQNSVIDATIKNIKRKGNQFVVSIRYSHAKGEETDLTYDRVITCTGFRFDDTIFDDACKPALAINNRMPKQTYEWESTNIKDLYFAGTLMQMRDYKHTTSGFIHGFRYNCRILQRILDKKYHGVSLPCQQITANPEQVLDSCLQRINQSSALWQQFGFIGDLIVIDEGQARYYEELPLDYIHNTELGQNEHYYTVTLEFGQFTEEDPFHIERDTDPSWASKSPYLHPVIRRFCGSKLVAEQHLLEDINGEWKAEKHIAVLREFFQSQLLKHEMLVAV
ncbi:NAD(P)-binding domain-containing protein [Candidatus Albibeggiatoa sp. nov. NOAA]|uniref:NAD(P)-binding domain-containing protein n=1 Tax=Candidatus Albibeggiatoa sp. nov. NOAA TaxID=3162724 RepID=UPI0032F7C33F|nr:NAD(P)-binding domain-containing protein [Thiotrichaceae bacterium]